MILVTTIMNMQKMDEETERVHTQNALETVLTKKTKTDISDS